MVQITEIDYDTHIESRAAVPIYLARGLVKDFCTQGEIL